MIGLMVWSKLFNLGREHVLILPDYFSQYYLGLLGNTPLTFKTIKFLHNFISYSLFEFLARKCGELQVLGKAISSVDKEVKLIPSQEIIDFTVDAKKPHDIFIPLPSLEACERLFLRDRIQDLDVKILVLSRNETILNMFNDANYSNVSVIEYIKDYASLTSKYRIHISIDHVGTGMSTKIMDCLGMGCFPLGNRISFRGIDTDKILEFCIDDIADTKLAIVRLLKKDQQKHLLIREIFEAIYIVGSQA